MHEESSSRRKVDDEVHEGAIPAYLLDRENTTRAKVNCQWMFVNISICIILSWLDSCICVLYMTLCYLQIMSNTIKQKRKEKAGKWEVPLPKVRWPLLFVFCWLSLLCTSFWKFYWCYSNCFHIFWFTVRLFLRLLVLYFNCSSFFRWGLLQKMKCLKWFDLASGRVSILLALFLFIWQGNRVPAPRLLVVWHQ